MLSPGPGFRSPSPFRILFAIARGDSFGGSSRHVMDLVCRLRDAGHEARILVGGTPDREVPRRFAERDLDFLCIPTLGRRLRPLHDSLALHRIRREIRRFRPDLISLHSSKAGGLGRIASLGLDLPVLYTPHCWSFVEGQRRARFYHHVERWLAPLATRIVTVCEHERHHALEQGVGSAEQFVAIHNGVRDSFADVIAREMSPGEAPPLAAVRIAMVGRFEEQKDQALLLAALAKLCHLPWRLTLVGEGPLREACLDQARRDGIADRVTFCGYSNGVEDILASHDLLALVTRWEGFPRSILEAMSASLPVLATDVGGCREAIEDGKTGWLVPPGDLDGLTRALRGILENPGRLPGMGRAGRERYLEAFTFERMFPRYRELYRELIAGPSRPRAFAPARGGAPPRLLGPPLPQR